MVRCAFNMGAAGLSSVGILGGTFNPVHIGHLRTAVELREALALDEMRLMPCAVPPHRVSPEQISPGVTAVHRLGMLRAAIGVEPGLLVDDRELHREGTSYTIDSLVELRQELGDRVAICLCIGMDSLVNLASWRRWRELLDYVHIVVVARPGWSEPQSGDEVAEWVDRHLAKAAEQLHRQPAGLIWMAEMTRLPVSSTEIRDALGAGRSARYLLPDSVIDYIEKYSLYS